ncbi:MAG: phytoene desaturase family protein [Nitrososphaerales archaeon]
MQTIPSEFDVIVVGGGMNGLTTAAYLAKTGLKTVVIERRDQLGTHETTEEWSYPGFRTSPHTTSHWVGHSPCMLDLDLERYGLELYPARFSRAMPFKDGTAMVPDLWDANGFFKAYKMFSENDAKVYRDVCNAIVPLHESIYMDFLYSQPSPENWDSMVEKIASLPHVPSDWWKMTGFELIDLLFEDEHIKAWAAGSANEAIYSPTFKINGPLGAILLATGAPAQQAMGGSHQVPHAMFRCIVEHGGKILQSCEVEKIIVKDGEAKGVILSKFSAYPEKKIMAKRAIISNLSPVPTFVDLIGEEHLDRQAYRILKYQYDYDWQNLFTSSFMITDLPKWNSTEFNPNMKKAWVFACGAESLRDVERSLADLVSGRIPDPITALGGDYVVSLYDETAAPPGFHNLQFWTDVPFNLRKHGGPEKWDDITDEIVDKVAEMFEGYAPGFRRTIKHKVGISPLDTFRKNPSALSGQVSGGVPKPGQLYFDRPFLGCNAPRTPIHKLYLSNGTWPFGNSNLASGYIAACEVIKDLGIQRPNWWSHRTFEWYRQWMDKNGVELRPRVTL